MPRIPLLAQTTRISGTSLGPGQVDSTVGVRALGGAVNDILEVHQQNLEQDAALWVSSRLSEAQTTWAKNLSDRQSEAEDGAPEFSANVSRDFERYANELSQQAPTRASREFMRERLNAFRTGLVASAQEFEATERAAYTERNAIESIDVGATLSFQSPDAFPDLLAERLALFEAQRLQPEQRRRLTENAQRTMARSAILGMAETDPEGAFRAMTMPAGTSGILAVDALTAEDRIQLIEYAQRKALHDAEQAENAAELLERQTFDETAKTGDEMLREGRMTPSWIQANRDRLSAEDYRYFNRSISGPEAQTNPVVYAELREAASFGQDVRADARSALTRGDIGLSDYDRLLGEVEASRPNWYSRGADYIATSAAVSDINPDPASAQRKAEMLDEWSVWAQANPNATADEARETYQGIVREYALVDYEQMLLMQRKPRYLVGTRSEPDFQATAQATEQAYQSGEIDETEYRRQQQVIVELSEAWQRAQTR